MKLDLLICDLVKKFFMRMQAQGWCEMGIPWHDEDGVAHCCFFMSLHSHTCFSPKHKVLKFMVKSKETVKNSWTDLKVILGHKYHHNH